MQPGQTATERLFQEPYDFSLVLGGPLFQIYRRAHLTGDALELLHRRVIVICLFAWLPPLVLSVLEGHAWGGTVDVPFLWDVHAHGRFLVALPLFILAELMVHKQLRPLVRQFINRGLVPETGQARFDAALSSAFRMRNSVVAEVLLILIVYLVGVLVVWRSQAALPVTTWYGSPEGGRMHPTLAGWWFILISLPLFQFILLRWYYRLFIWAQFLWRVTRIELKLVPTNPDQAGGLGFLALTVLAFAPLLVGHSVLVASWVAGRIFFANAELIQFKLDLLVYVGFMLVIVVGPLLVFAPHLERARRAGLREYGSLASSYVREFEAKWVRGGSSQKEMLLGSPDIQSLADMGNSLDRVRAMKLLPFGKDTFIRTMVLILLPLLPLLLTMLSLEELLSRVLKVIF
jgi:hypothetical protein